jgi:hypothetical protein
MALALTETDVFQIYEQSGAKMVQRIKALVTNGNAATIVNEKLEDSTLGRFGLTFKEPIALKALNAVRNGDLVLFVAKPEYNLPECLPFFRYVMKGNKPKVAINLTNIIVVEENPNDPTDTSYLVEDMRKLYAMLVSAYIQLTLPDPSHFPIKAIEYGSMMWARMFCKVLNRTIGLSSNKERYEAYFYFADRFFLKYMIGVPDSTVEGISKSLLKSGEKTPLILMIEEKCDSAGIDLYKDFTSFCQALFSNDVSGIKGMRMVSANPNETLNVSFFLRRFVDTYNQSSVMSLASVHYFTWMVVCTLKKAYMMNIKMLGDVVEGTEGTRYLAALYTEACSK